MAKFDLPDIDHKDQVFEEGIKDFAKDATNAVLDVDVNKVRDAWSNASGANGYLGVIDDTGKRGVDALDSIGKAISHDRKVDTRSLFARAKNSICQFPIYVSQSIRVNEAHIISKMFERVYASLMQAVLAQQPIASEDDVQNMKFLRKIHTNLRESADLTVGNMYYTPIDMLDEMMTESVFYQEKINDNISVTFRHVNVDDPIYKTEFAHMMGEPLEGFNYLIEAKTPKTDKMKKELEVQPDEVINRTQERDNRVLKEEEIADIVMNDNDISANDQKLYKQTVSEVEHAAKGEAEATYGKEDYHKSDVEKFIKDAIAKKHDVDKKIDGMINDWKDDVKSKGKLGVYQYKNGTFIRQDIKTTYAVKKADNKPQYDRNKDVLKGSATQARILKDVEIKKLNGMDSYPIEVAFLVRTASGHYNEVKFIIGVKSVLHLINPKDLAEDLREIVTGKIKKLQKVRYKTGEISFKDYMFNQKAIKKDAAKGIQYNKKWINTLKRLSEYGKMNGTLWADPAKHLAKGDVPIPNGTMILSQADVTTLTAETGIDLSTVANAKRMAKSLFLIAVAIVDGSAGTMKVLFVDSQNDWDVQSLASIEAEVSKTDNSPIMRELNRMVNR